MQFISDMSPRDWLWIIFEVAAVTTIVVAFVWRAVRMPLDYRIAENDRKIAEGMKSQGERIGVVETGLASNGARMNEMSRLQQQQDFQIASANKELGRLEGILERIDTNFARMGEARHEDDVDIRERLARIETSVQIFSQLKDVMVMAVQRGNEANKSRGGSGGD